MMQRSDRLRNYRVAQWNREINTVELQWNPTLVAPLFKGYLHLRDNTVRSRIYSGFCNDENLFLRNLYLRDIWIQETSF